MYTLHSVCANCDIPADISVYMNILNIHQLERISAAEVKSGVWYYKNVNIFIIIAI